MERTESAIMVTRSLLFTWRGSECVHVQETDITPHHLILRMHTCRNVGNTCKGLNFGLFLYHFFPLSTVAWGASRWHCAAVCETSPRTVMLRFCLYGLSLWIHCCVLRGIWMPHFTLMLSLFFGYFCFSQPFVLREKHFGQSVGQ